MLQCSAPFSLAQSVTATGPFHSCEVNYILPLPSFRAVHLGMGPAPGENVCAPHSVSQILSILQNTWMHSRTLSSALGCSWFHTTLLLDEQQEIIWSKFESSSFKPLSMHWLMGTTSWRAWFWLRTDDFWWLLMTCLFKRCEIGNCFCFTLQRRCHGTFLRSAGCHPDLQLSMTMTAWSCAKKLEFLTFPHPSAYHKLIRTFSSLHMFDSVHCIRYDRFCWYALGF